MGELQKKEQTSRNVLSVTKCTTNSSNDILNMKYSPSSKCMLSIVDQALAMKRSSNVVQKQIDTPSLHKVTVCGHEGCDKNQHQHKPKMSMLITDIMTAREADYTT